MPAGAILGVYEVLAYAVSRRTQEIWIRGALGASRDTIGRMVVVDGVRLAAGVFVVAAGASWLPARRAVRVDPLVALRAS